MRARHYDPTIGRFLSEDPIWSTNLYPYADNNPIMGIDPEGKAMSEAEIIAKSSDKAIEYLRESREVLQQEIQAIKDDLADIKDELSDLTKDITKDIQCYWDPSKPQCKGGNYPSHGLKDEFKENAETFAHGMLFGAQIAIAGFLAYVGAEVVIAVGTYVIEGIVVAVESGYALIATTSASGGMVYLWASIV